MRGDAISVSQNSNGSPASIRARGASFQQVHGSVCHPDKIASPKKSGRLGLVPTTARCGARRPLTRCSSSVSRNDDVGSDASVVATQIGRVSIKDSDVTVRDLSNFFEKLVASVAKLEVDHPRKDDAPAEDMLKTSKEFPIVAGATPYRLVR